MIRSLADADFKTPRRQGRTVILAPPGTRWLYPPWPVSEQRESEPGQQNETNQMSWTVCGKPCALRRQTSKVGTVCASRASTGLCGGQRATAVPTATKLRAAAATGAMGRITLLIESDKEQAFFQSPTDPRRRDQLVLRTAAGAAVHGCPLRKPGTLQPKSDGQSFV